MFLKGFFLRVVNSQLSPVVSVGSIEDMRTGGCQFKSLFWPMFFLRIDGSDCNRIHSSLTLSIVSTMVMWGSRQWLGKTIVQSAG